MSYLRYLFYLLVTMQGSYVAAQSLVLDQQAAGTSSEQILKISDGSKVAELPVKVVRGVSDGPVFTIVAGIHGYEYPPIIALQQFMAELDPKKLKGTVMVVPVANVAGFYGRSVFYNPLDNKNLNRVFPGKSDGTISERLAHLITTEIISKSSVFLDIHAGDGSEDLTDFVCYYDNKARPNQTALARTLAETTGFPLKVVYPFNLKSDQPAEYAFKQATRQGITALSMEAGKLGNVQDESVQRIKDGVFRMLSYLKMYEKNYSLISNDSEWLNGQEYIKSPEKGIFYSNLKSGATIQKGHHLGYITDLFGKKLAEITATRSGIILYKLGTPPVLAGETLFCIGYSN